MLELGTVLNNSGKYAKVLIRRHAACGECGACQVGKEKMTMETRAENKIDAKPGQTVLVEMQTINVLTATGIAYGLPLLGFLIGALAGWYLAPVFHIDQPLLAFSLALLLTIIVYGAIYILERHGAFNLKFQPVITGIAPEEVLTEKEKTEA